MANSDKIAGVVKGVVIKSIGVAIALDTEKEKNSSIIVAYAKGDAFEDIRFTAMPLPKKQLYNRASFLSAICQAENVKNVTYTDFDGKDKDIYVCRAREGDVYDFVERDDSKNKYLSDFAEIEASCLDFVSEPVSVKHYKPLTVSVRYDRSAPEYPENSIEYAVTNAFNACLLGRLFTREEFRLETGDGERVKFAVRSVPSRYVDLTTIYVKPEIFVGEKRVSAYVTEEIKVINGNEMSTRIYKLAFRPSANDYYITKMN